MFTSKVSKYVIPALTLILLTSIVWMATADSEEITLRVTTWIDFNNEQNVEAWTEILDTWYEQYPHIKIELEMIPYSGYRDKVATLVASGLVDVIDMHDGWFSQWASSGAVLDLTPFVERDLNLSEYFEASLDRGYYPRVPRTDGRMYSIWTFMSPAILYVNQNIFDQAGIVVSHDWTYDDVATIAHKLYSDLNNDGVPETTAFGAALGSTSRTSYGMGSILRAFGADDYTPDGEWYAFDTPEHRAAFEWAFDLIDRGLSPVGQGTGTFKSGSVGLHFGGTFEASNLDVLENLNWTMVSPPAGPAGKKVMLHGNPSLSIAAHTDYPEESWAFIRHILENQTATNVYLAGNIPTKRSAAADWIAMGAEKWSGFDPQAVVTSIDGAVYVPKISLIEVAAADSAINSLILKAFRKETSLTAALEEATRQANAILAAAREQ